MPELYVIAKDDEPIYDEPLLRAHGYTHITRCPVIASDGVLKTDPALAWFVPKRDLTPFERSLALSWSNMLVTNLDAPDNALFCESDVSPRVSARAIEGIVDSITSSYDVFRPFVYLADYDSPPPKAGYIDIKDFIGLPFKSKNDAENLAGELHKDIEAWKFIYGTHALVVKRSARLKLAAAFRRCKLPVDVTLCLMAFYKQFSVKMSVQNLFVQAPHESWNHRV